MTHESRPGKAPVVAVIGQHVRSRRLAEDIHTHAGLETRLVDVTQVRPLELIRAIKDSSLVLRVGFRPAARTWRGVAFDMLWFVWRILRPKTIFVFVWNGSDAMNAASDASHRGRFRRWVWADALRQRHVAVAPWLTESLRSLGVQSTYCAMPLDRWNELVDSAWSFDRHERLRVLTYISDRKHEFYGSAEVVAAAHDFPDIDFEVIGSDGAWAPDGLSVPNLRFLGWVDNVEQHLASCHVFVRLVPHDGMPHTVRQALLMGRQVIYTHPLPHVAEVDFGDADALRRALTAVRDSFDSGSLAPNELAREYVMSEFDPTEATRRLVAIGLNVW